jgi:hypothetical protein
MILLLQIAMAERVERLVVRRRAELREALAGKRETAPAGRREIIVIVMIVVLGLLGQAEGVVPAVPSALLPEAISQRNCCVDTEARYSFLSSRVGYQEVVLAGIWPSWVVPTFGGKSVAAPFPLAFVDDLEDRRADVLRFFDPRTTTDERRHIIGKYRASYVLVERKQSPFSLIRQAERADFGRVIYADNEFLLIKVRPSR